MELSLSRKIFLTSISFAFFLVFDLSAQASTESSIAWIKTQQQVDGGFKSPSSTLFQSTSEVLETSILLNKTDQPYFASALHYLNTAPLDDSTENLSRRVSINYRSGANTTADVGDLLLRQNKDGGFGSRIGYDSTVFDTSIAMRALGIANVASSSVTDGAISFIVNSQSQNGGWSFSRQQNESLSLTSLALETLRLYSAKYNLTNSIAKGSDYLYSLENGSQGWGNSELTSDALIALIPLTIDGTKYSAALSYLKAVQNNNQSWDSDAYITARALQVIYLSQNAPPPIITNDYQVRGHVIDSASGLPIGGVNIALSGALSATAVSDASGDFHIAIDKVGSYALGYSFAGFVSKTQTFNLVKLQSINAGSISLEKIVKIDPQVAFISGVIRDSNQGTGVPGAKVEISGSASTSVITDSNGAYSISLTSTGNITIVVSKVGYQSAAANAASVLGQAISFSPALYKDTEQVPAKISVNGTVVDSTSNTPLSTSTLTLSQGSASLHLAANTLGELYLDNISSGPFSFTVSAPGYESVSGTGLSATGSRIELGQIRLKPSLDSSVITGLITNATSGEPISGAIVKIIEEVKQTSTALNGTYNLSNITHHQFSVEVSATGFKSEIYQVNAVDYQGITLNAQLHAVINPTGFGINSIAPTKTSFTAYEKATFVANVYNNGGQQEKLQMVMELKNDQGFFKRFPAAHSAFPGDEIADTILILQSNSAATSVEFNWLTDVMPQGEYQLRLMAYDAKTLQFKAEQSTTIRIAETKNITALVAKASPTFTYFHAQKEMVFTAEATNASNVAQDISFKFRWKDPNGVLLKEGVSSLHLEPTDTQKFVELSRFTHLFEASGDYLLELESLDGKVSSNQIYRAKTSVAPAVRIDPSLQINPTVVTPEQDKLIRLNIILTGKDEQ